MFAGLLLTACDSSEPRAADEDFGSEADSSSDEKKSPESGRDADASVDGSTSKDVKTSDGEKKADAGDKSSAADKGCGEETCSEPAECKDDRCVCPKGYEDVEGDGSKCEDIDECKERTDDCQGGTVCKNEPGGFSCNCSGPAYVKKDDSCACAEGYSRNDDGNCVGKDGMACADNFDCESGACEGEICCAQACADPGECQTTEGATCSDGKTCKYPRAEDGSACDDGKACTTDGTCKEGKCMESPTALDCDDNNPCTDDSCEEPTGCRNQNNTATCDDGDACTSMDQCTSGECKGDEVDCSAAADVCNVGACDSKSGECIKQPRKESVECDDANSCTTGDTCEEGICTGGGSACGPNATACEPGEVNMCTCQPDFVSYEGRCVPTNDECQSANPCSPDAVCTDPSNMEGDVTCACKPGFKGDGKECVATNPCATEPCGAGGTCNDLGDGKYSCTCPTGQRELGGTCTCDLSGDFALRIRQEVQWKDIDDFVEDGNATPDWWLLVRNTYDADGKLSMEVRDCGSTGYDICSVPYPPLLGAEAYGQYVPDATWDSSSMPTSTLKVSLAAAQPGSAFKTSNVVLLAGIKLDDPMGEWPADRTQVGGGPESQENPVNGALWLDHDNDGTLGVMAFGVGPGGVRADAVPPPPAEIPAKSAVCPRLRDGDRYDYAYPPAVPSGSLQVQRIKRVSLASRAIFAFDGTIDSCDVLTGNIVGPKEGKAQYDARSFSCIRATSNGESVCSGGAVDFLDQAPANEEYTSAKFKLQRLGAGGTCTAARSASFD